MNTLYILWSSEKEYKSIHKVTDLIINSGNGNRYILFLQGEYVDYSFCNAEVFFLKGNRRSIKGKRFYYFNKMKLLGELSKLIEKLSIDTIWLDGVGCLKFFSGIKKIQGYSINVIIHNEIRDVGVSRDF
ncbi:hypothetical protein VQ643_12805, partial [Pseudomonas sp. F1_0610]|uniref:hypothetical protein n=1 Tax=Pseudomonas sp. F1_0610 TaxID=3114284 RepID=UPI0039C319AD